MVNDNWSTIEGLVIEDFHDRKGKGKRERKSDVDLISQGKRR